MEENIIKSLIEGYIPIELTCHYTDIAMTGPIKPFYGLYSRYSYLPIISRDFIDYLLDIVVDIQSNIWYDAPIDKENDNSTDYTCYPLKTNLPLGVLFDLCHSLPLTNKDFPWKITIHFSNFPNDLLYKCNSIDLSERFYYQSLKQSIYLLNNSTNVFHNLSSDNQKDLWDGIVKASYDSLFRSREIAQSLYVHNQIVNDNGNLNQYLPVRLIRYQSLQIIQPSIKINNNIKQLTVYDLLKKIQLDSVSSSVVVQGIEMSLQAPLFELWKYFAHLDLFLYLIVIDI